MQWNGHTVFEYLTNITGLKRLVDRFKSTYPAMEWVLMTSTAKLHELRTAS